MKLIFVTGARGAIGRQIVALARSRGYRVAGLGHGAWSGDDLPPIDTWINGDVSADNLSALMRAEGRPDIVIHLAGGSLVGNSILHPGEDFRRSVEGAQRLFEWLRISSAATRLVVASSAAVYGSGHAQPITEAAPYAPTSPYGTHKAMVEMLACSYARQYGLAVAIVRLFSVYGRGLRKQLIWEIGRRLSTGERLIKLDGTGGEQRDFVHISDAARILLAAAGHADASSPQFNGCSGQGINISSLVERFASRFTNIVAEFSGHVRAGDPAYLVGNPERSRKAGLATQMTLDEGMIDTLDWIAATSTLAPGTR